MDLYNVDVWSLILTFCKKKEKKRSVNMAWNVAFMWSVKHSSKHETVNQKHTLYDILVGMMNWWIMHTATARGKRCVLALIISLGFF